MEFLSSLVLDPLNFVVPSRPCGYTRAALDFAIFPIGDVVTMGVDDAIEAAKIVKVNKVLGVHYNTFGFIKLDKANAIKTFGESDILLSLPEIGESFDIG